MCLTDRHICTYEFLGLLSEPKIRIENKNLCSQPEGSLKKSVAFVILGFYILNMFLKSVTKTNLDPPQV